MPLLKYNVCNDYWMVKIQADVYGRSCSKITPHFTKVDETLNLEKLSDAFLV